MDKYRNIVKGVLFVILIGIMIFLPLKQSFHKVEAGTGGGAGDPGTGSSWGYYWNVTTGSKGTAWNQFETLQKSQVKVGNRYVHHAYNLQQPGKLKSVINGFTWATGGSFAGMDLYTACKNSDTILWYGAKNFKNDGRNYIYVDQVWIYKEGWMFPRGSRLNEMMAGYPSHYQSMTLETKDVFDRFKTEHASMWNTGNVVLICSGTVPSADPPTKLTVKAGSKTATYSGSRHSVTTGSITSGSLKSGHSINIVASGGRTAAGTTTTKVTSVNIVDKNNKNVNSQYDIKLETGTVRVNKKPVTVTIDSATKKYTGRKLTIDTWKRTAGGLVSGHSLKVTTSGGGTNVGYYTISPNTVKVMRGATDLTTNYSITTITGKLTIYDQTTTIQTQTRCDTRPSESASADVRNTTSGSPQYVPQGARFNSTSTSRWTTAGNYANSNPIKTGDSLSKWRSWKSTFENGSSSTTPDISLESIGVTSNLSQYGGVYNITGVTRRDTYKVDICQPQYRQRTVTTTTTPTGTTTTYGSWSGWTNDGSAKVNRVYSSTTANIYTYYQILLVNCNDNGFTDEGGKYIQGFNQIYNKFGIEKHSLGSTSSFMRTKNYTSLSQLPLGKTGDTANSKFYTDGTSCDIFKCTSTPLVSANNDANNNQSDPELFNEIDRGEYLKTNSRMLTFFRDNKERQVRADVWYPKTIDRVDVKIYSANPAHKTYVRAYKGTPEIGITTIKPWGTSMGKITRLNTTTTYNGSINRFEIKSQWASNEGKPYEIGVNWEYKARVLNKAPTTVNGTSIKNTRSFESFFDVNCPFRNTTGEVKGSISETPFANGRSVPIWNSDHAIRVLFSRAVSD